MPVMTKLNGGRQLRIPLEAGYDGEVFEVGALGVKGQQVSSVVPAKAGTHNHWRSWLLREESLNSDAHNKRHGVWAPAFAGTTLQAPLLNSRISAILPATNGQGGTRP